LTGGAAGVVFTTMLTLQIICTAGGGILTLINLVNVFLNNRTRADIAELKTHLAEARAADKSELREWAEAEFARKDTMDAKFDAIKARLA
jgi:hypothetical protein